MLPRQVVTNSSLLSEGFTRKEIESMSAGLKLFPTPFKGIYYTPGEEEQKGKFIDKPEMVLYRAAKRYLKSDSLYFSCRTAEERWAIKWQPTTVVHMVNEKISRTINLQIRIERNEKKKNWRAKNIARILSMYGTKIIFHKVPSIVGATVKPTPYGTYAMASQIKKDKKRFREKEL